MKSDSPEKEQAAERNVGLPTTYLYTSQSALLL